MKKTLRVIYLFIITLLFLSLSNSYSSSIKWQDFFIDQSKIEILNNTTQATNINFGKHFDPLASNPLLSIESCDPWDSNGDPYFKIISAVHPDVLYFPEGKGGYKFWMVFTPFGKLPWDLDPTLEPAYIPQKVYDNNVAEDYWWERMTLVRSNDGINWEKTQDYQNPLIDPGPDVNAWDGLWHCDPDLVYAPNEGPNGESWFLYFTGSNESGARNGVAISHDGLNYVKLGPVSPVYTRCPAVVYNPDTGVFHKWYNYGNRKIGYATSQDGINYSPYNPTNPGVWGHIVFEGTINTYDSYGISHMDVVYHDGQYLMYYLAMPNDEYGGLLIGIASSIDGINWKQYPQPAITPTRYSNKYTWEYDLNQNWDFSLGFSKTIYSLYRPSAVILGDKISLYYCGTDHYISYPECFNYEIGFASGEHKGLLKLKSSEYFSRPDTIAWYHFNELPSNYTIKSNTVGWYHFNEGNNNYVNDFSGFGNNGFIEYPNWMESICDYAIYFDGNDGITIPNSSELNISERITLEGWVKPNINKPNNYIISKITPGTNDFAYGMKLENTYTGYTELGACIADSSGNHYFSYGGYVPINEWSHVAMTYEVNSSEESHIKLYVNGKEVAYRYGSHNNSTDAIPPGTSIRINNGDLFIGILPYTTYHYFNGVIDEVRILNMALDNDALLDDSYSFRPMVKDSIGNEIDGNQVGDIKIVNGKYSNGLLFDGNSSYIRIPNSDFLNLSNEVVLEGWVKPNINKPNNYIISKITPGTNDFAYGMKLENTYTGYTELGACIADSSGNHYFSYGGYVPINEWSHVAMTYEVNSSEESHIKLYVNGKEIAYRYGSHNNSTDAIPPGTSIRINNGDLFIGASLYSENLYFNGIIDEIRILNKTINKAMIAENYNGQYEFSGSAKSIVITPPAGKTWGAFMSNALKPSGTDILYTLYNDSLPNNKMILIPGTDLSNLGDQPIQIEAMLSTNTPSKTPIIYDWSVNLN